MKLKISELYEGKSTIIKEKLYLSAKDYVQPFIDKLSKYTDQFIVNAIPLDQMMVTNNIADVVYNKVLIQAILKTQNGDLHDCISMCYALDVKKPIAKIYRCGINVNSGIIVAFDPMWQSTQLLEDGEHINLSCIDNLFTLTSNITSKRDSLSETPIDRTNLNRLLGGWIRRARTKELRTDYGNVKLSTTNALNAFIMTFEDKDSKFYQEDTFDTTLFDCYVSFGETIVQDKKDIINKFEKTLLISDILS